MKGIGLCEETTLLDLVTEPTLNIREWLIRAVDAYGPFLIPLEEMIRDEDPGRPEMEHFWNRPICAITIRKLQANPLLSEYRMRGALLQLGV